MAVVVARSAVPLLAAAALLLPLLAAGAPAPALAPTTLTAEERAWLRDHGPIRLVVGLEVPPTVFFGPDGRAMGIALDLLNLIDVKLGVPYQVVRVANFSAALEALRLGDGDLIGPITADPAREGYLDHTAPFISGSIAFWVPRDSPLQDPAELGGRRVAVVAQGVSGRWLAEHRPDIVPVKANNTLEALRLTASGGADATLGGIAVAAYHLQQGDVQGLRALGSPVQLVDGGWAVPEGQPQLLAVINKGMASISPAERTQIFTKWTGYDLGPATPGARAFVLPEEWRFLALGAGALIVLLGVGTVVLRRKVAGRTRELADANALLARDLALRERAEQELARSEKELRTVFEAAPVGIVKGAEGGRVVRTNPAFAAMLGLPPEALVGTSILDLAIPADRPGLARLLDDLAEGRRDRASVESRFAHRDGREVWGLVEAAAVRGPEGDLQHMVAMVTDLTGRRRAEADRRAAEERAAEVARLKEVDRERTRFISTTAHELNTPLTPIHLQLEILRHGDGPLTPRQQKSVAMLDRNFGRLQRLIKDLLQAARLQAGKLQLRPERLDVVRVVAEAVESFQEAAQQAGLTVELEGDADAVIEADAARVAQVVYNLLSNAIKFTPPGGRITIGVRREAGGVGVRVTDTGIGLRPEDVGKLFQPFAQIEGEDGARRDGTGLGLFLSRGIVEQHGGRLWCESPGPGRGATFAFQLPAAPPVASIEAPLAPELAR